MRKYILTLMALFCLLPLSMQARTEYSCFLSQFCNLETGEVFGQQVNNSLKTIYLDGNKLYIDSKTITLYNKTVSNKGLSTITYYDAIDNKNQKCQVRFIVDESADWTTKYSIIIWYNEISNIATWYLSREPIIK